MPGAYSIRNYFPGANSALGFYSFYDQMMLPGSKRTYIIKGGPGTGKSTFMRETGRDLEKKGLFLEYHYCSSDPFSLDGLVAPALGTVLLDGTPPHAVEPRYPGALEEIINLGEYWLGESLRKNSSRIVLLVEEIKRQFGRAYGMLSSARSYLSLTESYYERENPYYLDYMNQCARKLVNDIFPDPFLSTIQKSSRGKRKLFLTSITSQGTVSFLKELEKHYSFTIAVRGDDRRGKEQLMTRLVEAAHMQGFQTEIFFCALCPRRIEHLALPELDCAVVSSAEPHFLAGEGVNKTIDTGEYIFSLSGKHQAEKEDLLTRFRSALEAAVSYLKKARLLHEELESYYIPAMDFEAVEQRRRKVVEEILSLS